MIYKQAQVAVNLLRDQLLHKESNKSWHFFGGGKGISISDYA